MAGLDPLLGIHADALRFQKQRMEVLAANIANADTPGYQAKDLDFSAALASAQSATPAATTDSRHIPLKASAAEAGRVFRLPTQPSADGNTVELQVEQAKFADAAMHYKASLSFIDGRIRSLLTAITGQ